MAASMPESYKIRSQIFGHEKDVRGICAALFPDGAFVSGSRDVSTRLWLPNDDDLGYHEMLCFTGHSNFVSCVCVVPPDDKYPQGLILSGSNDNNILAFSLESPEPVFKLSGHSDTVCSLAAGKFGSLLSGSWDKTAKVWLNQKCVMTLQGHEAAVWAVVILPEGGYMLTASADKLIKLWKAGKCEKTFRGHEDCVRGLAVLSSAEFLSCSNDSTVRRWLVSGDCTQIYYGHTNYVYSISVMPNGEDFVTGGEDRTLRVWQNGECIQTVTHPAQSVWSVCALPNGDIVTGGSDGVLRIFSRSPDRQSGAEEQQAFLDSVANANIPSQIGDVKTADLPGPEALLNVGTKDGQTIMVKDGNSITAHSWNASESRWDKIGDVVGASGSNQQTSGKQLYEGKEYDYVFDVEIEDGKPPLKLPYNIAEDPYMAAHNFLEKNEISQLFLDQVAKFIMDQCKGIELGTGSRPEVSDPFTGGGRYIPGALGGTGGSAGSDPFTGGGRYVPQGSQAGSQGTTFGADPFTGAGSYKPTGVSGGGDSTGPANPFFPQKTFISFDQANSSAIIGKVKDFNSSMETDKRLDDAERKHLEELITATTPNALQISALWKSLHWPQDKVFPILDILRIVVKTDVVSNHFFSAKEAEDFLQMLMALGNAAAPGANTMLVLRILTNAFKSPKSRAVLLSHKDYIIAAMVSCKDGGNKNIHIALASVLLNYAVAFNQSFDVEGKSQCLSALAEVIDAVKDGEAQFRLLVCIGSLITDDENSIAIAHSLGLPSSVGPLRAVTEPGKVGDCARFVFNALHKQENVQVQFR